jgi:hypothetical protein
LADTGIIWNDTSKLDVYYVVYQTKTLTGNLIFKEGQTTKCGNTEERCIVGSGNSYTVTFPATWHEMYGSETFSDVLNVRNYIIIHKSSDGIIMYKIFF